MKRCVLNHEQHLIIFIKMSDILYTRSQATSKGMLGAAYMCNYANSQKKRKKKGFALLL